MGNFPSLFLATVNSEGGLEYYDGVIRIVDGAGNAVADGSGSAATIHRIWAKPAKITRT